MARIICLAYNRHVKILFIFIFPLVLFAEIQSKDFPPGSVTSLQIHNFLGPIEVRAALRTRVTVKKYDFVPACHLTSKLVEGTILLKATREEKLFSWVDEKSCRVEMILEVPADLVMYLKSNKGDLKVSGVTGDIVFDVKQGKAEIEGKAKNLTGVVERGDIKVRGAAGNVSLKAFRGDIEVHYQKVPFSAELDLIAKRGDIALYLPKECRITGSWKAPQGKLINDFTFHKTSLFNLHLEAEQGNLTIKKISKD